MFDPTTGKSELGDTVADAARNATEAEQRADLKQLLSILTQHPDIEHGALLKELSGMKQASKLKLIGDNVRRGSIIKSGKGVRGSPLTYKMADLPVESTPAGDSSLPTVPGVERPSEKGDRECGVNSY